MITKFFDLGECQISRDLALCHTQTHTHTRTSTHTLNPERSTQNAHFHIFQLVHD